MKKKLYSVVRATIIPTVAFLIMMMNCVSLSADVKKLLLKDKQLPDMGITNEVHKANVGKIVFSSDVVDLKKPDPNAFKTNFTQNDNIYARFYLSESLENHIYHEKRVKITYPKYECEVYVDGVLQPLVMYKNAYMSEATDTTRPLKIRVPRTSGDWGDTGEWVKFVNSNVKAGNHTVRLDLKSPDTGKIVASGEFTYEKGKTPALYGTSLEDYAGGMIDKTLEKKMFETVKSDLTLKDESWVGIKIFSDDWNIVKHENGNILSHNLGTWLQSKKSDGTFWVRAVFLGQQYNGSGYNNSFFVVEYQDEEEVDE